MAILFVIRWELTNRNQRNIFLNYQINLIEKFNTLDILLTCSMFIKRVKVIDGVNNGSQKQTLLNVISKLIIYKLHKNSTYNGTKTYRAIAFSH